MGIDLEAPIIQRHAAIAAKRQHGPRPAAGGGAEDTADADGAGLLEVAIGGADLGIEEDVPPAPVGIAGQHVPLGVGAGGAGQVLDDIAAVKGKGAAIPAIAGRAGIHTQYKAEAVILVGGDGAVGAGPALIVDLGGEFLAP